MQVSGRILNYGLVGHFVAVPEETMPRLQEFARPDGQGRMRIRLWARIGGATWATSLESINGRYVVPIDGTIRIALGYRPKKGDTATIKLGIDQSPAEQ
ncbi:DUF1905 domain-containing protein [Streptomyces swartbergensis]|uniref:DUF1905 domain-containing protein n=1 Tax=Streptomyces swartbergensis TaxID=487165 RepID=UPI003CC668E5